MGSALSRLLRFSDARGGNVMIEYALLGPIFFMLVIGLVEFVIFQYRAYALNHIVYEAARNLQTGEVQTSGDMEAAFRSEACAAAGPMIDCNDIAFDVRSFDDLNEAVYPEPEFDENGNPINFVFQPGGPSQYSVVRAAIHHTFITPFMGKFFNMGEDLPAIVNSFSIVRNEPWS